MKLRGVAKVCLNKLANNPTKTVHLRSLTTLPSQHYEKEYNGDVSWIDNFVKYKRGGQ